MAAETRRKERIDRPIKAQTDDIYALNSFKNMIYVAIPRLLPILVLLILPLIMPNIYLQRIVSIICVYALLAIGFDFLLHSVGLVSLGGALFFGLGAYTAGALNYYYKLPPEVTIPMGTVLGAAMAVILLLPCLPLRGIYFALVTLIFPLMFARVIEATLVLGGTDGLLGLTFLPNIWVEIYLVVAAALIALFALRRLLGTDLGLVMRAIRDNDQAVKASGINITLYKALAVFITAMLGSFAGAYITHLYGWVGLSAWSLDYSILPIAATVVGGMGTLGGPLLGCLILVPLSEALRAFGPLRIVFYSVIMVLFIVVWPEGLMNYLRRKYHQIERWVKI